MASSSTKSAKPEKEDDSYVKKDLSPLGVAELPEYNPGGAFETAGLKDYYRPIESYEGRHCYDDPSNQSDPKMRRKLSAKSTPYNLFTSVVG
jgi:hypothetical protein